MVNRRVGLPVGAHLLGRVIDPLGNPLDDKPLIHPRFVSNFYGRSIPALHRQPVSTPMDVGVRAINGVLTLAKGQRVGLIAGSGVGKSTLLGMMTRHTVADVVVLALIGERGREAGEFLAESLGPEGLRKSVVILATSDCASVMRRQAAEVAHLVAEYFRDQGKDVLLLCDSLTRIAHAQRAPPNGKLVWPPVGRPRKQGLPMRAWTPRFSVICQSWWSVAVPDWRWRRRPITSLVTVYRALGAYEQGTDPELDKAMDQAHALRWLATALAGRTDYVVGRLTENWLIPALSNTLHRIYARSISRLAPNGPGARVRTKSRWRPSFGVCGHCMSQTGI